jgi:hypothetical protein
MTRTEVRRVVHVRDPATRLDQHHTLLEQTLTAPRRNEGLALRHCDMHVPVQVRFDVVLPQFEIRVCCRHAQVRVGHSLLNGDGLQSDQRDE